MKQTTRDKNSAPRKSSAANPLELNIIINIIHIIIPLFPMLFMRRIRLAIKTFFTTCDYSFFSHDFLSFINQYHHKEKLNVNLSQGLKG